MKKFILSTCAVVIMTLSACSEKDEGPLGNTDDKKDEQYKEVCDQVNTNIESIRSLVGLLKGDDIIESVTPIKEGDKEVGYIFGIAPNQSISIYTDNKTASPAIGVKPDDIGDYYWTLNGEWLLDDAGKKIFCNGASYSILPKLKVEDGNWMLSVDNGKTWKNIGQVSSSNQENNKIFKKINISENVFVIFTFYDDTNLIIPREPELNIMFSEENQILIKPNSTIEIDYTITGKTDGLKVDIVTSGNLKAEIENSESTKGTITINTGASVEEKDKVFIIATNGVVTATKTLSFVEEEFVSVTSGASYNIGHEGGTIEFSIETNADYSISIPEDAKSWISVVESRAIRQETISLSIITNTGAARTATIRLVDKTDKEFVSIEISQAEGSIDTPTDTPIDIPSDMTKAFPDERFRDFILDNFDTNKDGILSEKEALRITILNVEDESITSLDGIQYFQNLENLNCSWNELTSLDVSKNTALTYLDCSYNDNMSTLNVSGCTMLKYLNCTVCQLTTLDVSNFTDLRKIDCSNNKLTSLNLYGCLTLEELECYDNMFITLDVSKNTMLIKLDCAMNELNTLNISACTVLEVLDCLGNSLTSLDLSNNKALTSLDCSANKLISLNVSENTALIELICNINELTSLDTSKNTALTYLNCDDNQLTTLDLYKNVALTSLSCDENQLTILDVSKNTNLTSLSCGDNQLTTLDVSKNTNLTSLSCRDNYLTSLDVSKTSLNKGYQPLFCNMPTLTTLYLKNGWDIEGISRDRNERYINPNTEIKYIN